MFGKEVDLSELEWKENESMINLGKHMVKGTEDD